ncbi:DUF3027 domain-containing protein [Flaviflexus equikiangi]|uniref:DUF3027 domain-containing protein n=1 Tax=Flaviflexus equikiangi TaxID=2758573 RepID=A0ABS2TCT7_9ACTO|nr:DUF3027 domain-containing protein [Flaviflexus equikiangi]MBM9432447.1 DUF3027 domain-containing protein [Flaviflexus equikiangi]
MSRLVPVQTVTKEKTLAQAVDLAREALVDITPADSIGDHQGVVLEAERVLTHAFTCLLPGYSGWFWAVTQSRAPRSRKVTVNELSLKPGPEALVAPEWVPWADRLEPDDVSGVEPLPYKAEDPRLVEGFEDTSDDADQLREFELGLGRARVLSQQGRKEAFNRWYNSDRGPDNPSTRAAKANCSTCAFMMLMAGSARSMFGVCANEWSPDDGKVVSLDHGCGAHSETDAPKQQKLWDQSDPVLNETDIEIVESAT